MVKDEREREERKAQKRLRNLEKQKDLRVSGAIGALLQHVEGREFLYWLLDLTNLHANPYQGNALGTSFACGEMNVGQKLLDRIIAVSPSGYLDMLKERQAEQQEHERISSSNGHDDSDAESDQPNTRPEGNGELTDTTRT